MRTIATMVPVRDVRIFFSGKNWSGPGWDGDRFEGRHENTRVEIEVSGLLYGVSVEAVDDPSDSDEVTTEDPLKAIADFLAKDLPGGEHFERMSSSPESFARAVAAAADSFIPSLASARALLRRLIAVVRTADEEGPPTMKDLESKARQKGWKASLKRGPRGEELRIDVSGIYEATVTVEEIVYSYNFALGDMDNLSESSTTDDPIREFERWETSDEVTEARRELRSQQSQNMTVPAPAS